MKRSLIRKLGLALLALITPALAWAATWTWTDVATAASANAAQNINLGAYANRAVTIISTVTYGEELGTGPILSFWHQNNGRGVDVVINENGAYALVSSGCGGTVTPSIGPMPKPAVGTTHYVTLSFLRQGNAVTAILGVNGTEVATLTNATVDNPVNRFAWGRQAKNSGYTSYSKSATYSVAAIGTGSTANPRAYLTAVEAHSQAQTKFPLTLETLQEITVSEDANISALNVTSANLKVTLSPGVKLTLDKALELEALQIVSEGTSDSPATIDATVENPFVNIITTPVITGTVELVADVYKDAKVSKSEADIVKIFSNASATEISPQTIASVITVASGKTLKLSGYLNCTADNSIAAGGTLEVVSGVTTFGLTKNGLAGALKVATGATFKNGKADAPAYTKDVKLDVEGTLEITDGVRWSLASGSTTTLGEGAVLKGTGENDTTNKYAFDWYDGATVKVNGNATIEGNIGGHNGHTLKFDVAASKVLTISGVYKSTSKLSVAGSGTVKLTNAENSYSGNTEIVSGATLELAGGKTGTGAISGSGAIKVSSGEAVFNTANGGYDGIITVDAGVTLKSEGEHTSPFGTNEVVNNGNLIIASDATAAVSLNKVSGSGTLSVNSGIVTLATGTYSGTTTIAGGTLKITGARPSYSNTTTVKSGATLDIATPIFTNDYTKTFADYAPIVTEKNATIKLTSGGGYFSITGEGTVQAVGGANFIYGLGGNSDSTTQNTISADLVIPENNEFHVRAWTKGTDLGDGNITVNGKIVNSRGTTTGADNVAVSLASGKTLSGKGTINAPVTFEAGSKLDASAGAITATSVILPTEGAVAVTLAADAENGDVVINCPTTGLDLQALNSGTPKFSFAANTDSNAIILSQAPVCSDGLTSSYMTLQEAVDALKAAGAPEMTAYLNYDTDESVKLPDGFKLNFWSFYGAEFSGTVTDIYGNPLEADENGSYTCPTYVAKASGWGLAETGYTSLQGAVDAALGVMGTATLLTDLEIDTPITINNNDAWFTIDLGGKTLKATGSSAIYVKDGNVTIKNGKIDATGVGIWICDKAMSADVAAFDFDSNETGNASVTLDSTLTVTSSADNCVLMYNGAVLSTAAKLTSSGEYATIQGTGLNANNATMITITGGSVTSTNNHAIYHPQPGALTITGGEITGVTGIEMRAGTLVMSGGTVTATGAYAAPEANGNGSTVEGAAIVLSQHVTGEKVTANITGGTITATGTDGKTFVVANTTDADPVDVAATIAAAVTVDLTNAQILIPTLKLDGDATNGYTLKTVVAAIGETKYETLAAAYEAVAEEGIITVLANITEGGLKITKPVTIDFSGYTYTIVSPGVGSGTKTSNGIQIVQSAEAVTLKNGTIQIAAEDAADFYILIQNYADLTLIDMTLDGTYLDKWIEEYSDSYTLSVNSGTVSLKGTTTIKANNDGDKSYAFDSHDYAEMGYDAPTVIVGENVTITGKVEVTGGTLDNKGEELDVVISSGTVKGEVTVNESSSYLAKVGDTYCDKVEIEAKDDESTKDAEARARAALELFTGIATGVEGTTAKVAYDFGISDIKVNRDTNGSLKDVTITAKVQKNATTAAGYADGVTVTVYADDTALNTATVDATNGTATLTVDDIDAINGKELTVKVSK